ncbi:MAG TPA: hypothetical protein VKQ06_01605, partial [Gammaproteobacteria bacterium]|nr:hypothetical protein [Gammaproteobacteria bacterium]
MRLRRRTPLDYCPSRLAAAAALVCLLGLEPLPAQLPEEAPWQPLFNGRNLSGWLPKIRGYAVGENFGRTFR